MSLLSRVVGLVRPPLSETRGRTVESSRLDPLLSLVRWRKPPWAPLAPTKLFRVRVKTERDAAEQAEMKMRYDHYKTQMRSLREHLRKDFAFKEELLTNRSQIDVERRHLARCVEENDTFNQRSAQFRSVREGEERRANEEARHAQLAMLEREQRASLEAAREQVRQAIRVSGQFISRENLDAAIEQALNTRQTYNFAIDKEGNRVVEQTDGSTVVVERQSEGSA